MSKENLCTYTTHLTISYPENVKFHYDGMSQDIEETLEGRGPVFVFAPTRFEVLFGSYGETADEAIIDSDIRVERILGHLNLWSERVVRYTIETNESEEELADYYSQLTQNPNYKGADVIPFVKPD